MRLVLVHGMRQEGKNPGALRKAWEDALHQAWRSRGLPVPDYDLVMPFYGDELDVLTQAARGGEGVVARGDGLTPVSDTERRIIEEMALAAGISDADVAGELGSEVVARGPANWEWVQALARLLEQRVPPLRSIGLSFVHQVDAYLTRPHIRNAVDAIVGPALDGRSVLVAHSLGTVIAYVNLRRLKRQAEVPLFVTLGSPLGINGVKDHIKPPKLAIPEGVGKWLNGTDERDYVALYASLDARSFTTGIENIPDIRNGREDAHLITDYLAHPVIAARIHAALT